MKETRIGFGHAGMWSMQVGRRRVNTSNLSVLLCGWTRMWDALHLYSPRLNYRSSPHHWWQPLVSKGYLNSLGSVELHLSLIAVQKVSLSVYWVCWTNIPKGGQACFVAELSSDEWALSNLDETHTCSHCNAQLDIPNTQSLIIHASAHILYDSTIGELDQPCCLCLRPSTHCILRVSHQSGDMHQIDLSHSFKANIQLLTICSSYDSVPIHECSHSVPIM